MLAQVSRLSHTITVRKEMGRATSAVLASLVVAKLIVDWDYMVFEIDACTEKLPSSRSLDQSR